MKKHKSNVRLLFISRVILVMLFLTLFLQQSSAQKYRPILSQQNNWNVLWAVCDASFTDTIYTINDSSKGPILYSSLYYLNDPVHTNKRKIGLLEENTANSQMKFYDLLTDESYLIYNMELEVGDTFAFYIGNDKFIKKEVTNTYVSNQQKHIVFESYDDSKCGPRDTIEFIEGVGSNVGIHTIVDYYNRGPHTYLLCHYSKDETIFVNKIFNGLCEINYTKTENNDNSLVNIKLVQSTLHIRNELSNGVITIYSLLGKQLIQENIINGDNKIFLLNIPKGSYVYALNINGKIWSKQFVKID